MNIPPGWYSDETLPGVDRYWDGNWWTADTRESAKLSKEMPQPPSEPKIDSIENSEMRPSTCLLSIEKEVLSKKLKGMIDRDQTIPVVLKIYDEANETLSLVSEILFLHANRSSRSLVRPKIQALVIWQKEHVYPTLAELGEAMEADFDLLVKDMGGPSLLPISIDQAWQNYVAPIKVITEQIHKDMSEGLRKIAIIENEYL